MAETSHLREGYNVALLRIQGRPSYGTVHVRGEVCSESMIISKVTRQRSLRVPLVKNQHMVETLPADTPNRPFNIGRKAMDFVVK